jgi:nucleoside-diphosphate-sugar epimerase
MPGEIGQERNCGRSRRVQLSGKNVVVTGGAGLIGSFVVELLVRRGAQVVVADDFSKGRPGNLSRVLDQVEIREGDLETREAMERALDGAEVVFHLASRAYGIGYSSTHHVGLLQHNEQITNNLLAVLAKRPIAHLLVASSSCVYPDNGPETVPELPLFQGEPELANRGYGWAKRFLEQKAAILAEEFGIPLTIVRPFNIYGERYRWVDAASQAIPMLVKKVLDGDDPVVVWGSGRQRRNYLHAEDCADAMVGLVAQDFRSVVNIGTEDTVTMLELVETICRLAGRRPRIVCDVARPEGRQVKSSDAAVLRNAYPGFRKSISLEQGLERMLGWYATEFDRAA